MTLYDYVFALYVQGMSVIPMVAKDVQKRAKFPWKQYQTVLPTEIEIEKWFKHATFQDTSIAIITGKLSDIVVIDSDSGEYSPLGLSTPLRVKTSRGYHLYFKYPKNVEIHNHVRLEDQKIDIRGEGGLVVVPYSYHHSGIRYTWESKDPKRIIDNIPYFNDLPELPESFLKLLEPKEINSKSYEWEKKFNLVEGEGRDDAIFKGARSLLARGMREEEMFSMMSAMNKTYKPPLSDDVFKQKIEQAIKYHKTAKPIPASPHTIKELMPEFEEMRAAEKEAPSTGFPSLDEIMVGFIPGHVITMTAQTNHGKTQLAVNFAVNVVRQGKKVAYIALEPDLDVITAFNACWYDTGYNDAPMKHPSDNFEIYRQSDIPDFKTLDATLEYYLGRYALIIVDHIGYFTNEGDLFQAQSSLLKKLAILTRRTKTAVLIIAHPKKVKDQYLGLNDISGSAAFSQDSKEVLLLNRTRVNPDQQYDYSLLSEATLSVAKKKVTKQNSRTYVKLKFQDNKVRILDVDAEILGVDNSKQVEDLF